MGEKSALGARMKHNYEDRTRYYLPRRTYTIIRLDGKSFHSYTKGRERPFDWSLHESMRYAMLRLCREAQGTLLGYTQSDEISILLVDNQNIATEAWFDGNIQKIASVSASVVTMAFNTLEEMQKKKTHNGHGYFDARVFTIPDPVEVNNYFVWRQKDAERNSLSMLAQAYYSQSQLMNKGREDLHEMLHEKGINWNNVAVAFKRGSIALNAESGWHCAPATIFTQDPVIYNLLGVPVEPKLAVTNAEVN